jgi:tRNA(Ile2) C34 agmatinyltransferase TiaS
MTTTETSMTTADCPICGAALRHAGTALRCDDCEVDYVDNADE